MFLLLDRKCIKINIADSYGLHLYDACRGGHTDIVRVLLAHDGIDVNRADRNGFTPLFDVCSEGLSWGLDHDGIDVNMPNYDDDLNLKQLN